MKMTKTVVMVGCVVSLLAPTTGNAFWSNIYVPPCEEQRDIAMMAMINRGTAGIIEMGKELERSGTISQATLQRVENDTAVMNGIASFADNGNVVHSDISVVNGTGLTVCRIQFEPRIVYGGAKPLNLTGRLGPRSAARLPPVGANAYYNIRIMASDGTILDFGEMFIGAGMHSLALTDEGWGRYRLSLM